MSNNIPDPVILERIAAWFDKNQQNTKGLEADTFKHVAADLKRIAKRLQDFDVMMIMIAKAMTDLPDMDVIHVSAPQDKMNS